MKPQFIYLLFPLLLLGCSTYSKKQCQGMDWYVKGKKAALDGYTPKQGKTHFMDKCQENQGVSVDFVEFERGFSSGLNILCSSQGRKALDAKDMKYQGTCESHEDSVNFQKTHTMELEEKIQDLEAEIRRLKAEVASLKLKNGVSGDGE